MKSGKLLNQVTVAAALTLMAVGGIAIWDYASYPLPAPSSHHWFSTSLKDRTWTNLYRFRTKLLTRKENRINAKLISRMMKEETKWNNSDFSEDQSPWRDPKNHRDILSLAIQEGLIEAVVRTQNGTVANSSASFTEPDKIVVRIDGDEMEYNIVAVSTDDIGLISFTIVNSPDFTIPLFVRTDPPPRGDEVVLSILNPFPEPDPFQ